MDPGVYFAVLDEMKCQARFSLPLWIIHSASTDFAGKYSTTPQSLALRTSNYARIVLCTPRVLRLPFHVRSFCPARCVLARYEYLPFIGDGSGLLTYLLYGRTFRPRSNDYWALESISVFSLGQHCGHVFEGGVATAVRFWPGLLLFLVFIFMEGSSPVGADLPDFTSRSGFVCVVRRHRLLFLAAPGLQRL